MKLAVAAVVSIALCLLSLSLRQALTPVSAAAPAAQPAGRAPSPRAAAEKRALASIDQRLHRKLRLLAAPKPATIVASSR